MFQYALYYKDQMGFMGCRSFPVEINVGDVISAPLIGYSKLVVFKKEYDLSVKTIDLYLKEYEGN